MPNYTVTYRIGGEDQPTKTHDCTAPSLARAEEHTAYVVVDEQRKAIALSRGDVAKSVYNFAAVKPHDLPTVTILRTDVRLKWSGYAADEKRLAEEAG